MPLHEEAKNPGHLGWEVLEDPSPLPTCEFCYPECNNPATVSRMCQCQHPTAECVPDVACATYARSETNLPCTGCTANISLSKLGFVRKGCPHKTPAECDCPNRQDAYVSLAKEGPQSFILDDRDFQDHYCENCK
jgi:hypothetical protein